MFLFSTTHPTHFPSPFLCSGHVRSLANTRCFQPLQWKFPVHEGLSHCSWASGAWIQRESPQACFPSRPAHSGSHSTLPLAKCWGGPHLPGLCPETEALGQNQPPSHGVSGKLRPDLEQNQPAGHGWQSSRDVAPGMGRRKPAGIHSVATVRGPLFPMETQGGASQIVEP